MGIRRGRDRRLLTAVLLGGLLAGCGGETDPGAQPDTTQTTRSASEDPAPARSEPVGDSHNDIDVDFAQMTILHHQQAIEMAELAVERGQDPQLVILAGQITTGHSAEVEELTALLADWGEELPTEIPFEDMDHDSMDHEGIGMGFMSSMLNDDELANLATREGVAFDRLYLRTMRVHHGGAIAMAYAERARGVNATAVDLATEMQATQDAQLAAIEDLIEMVRGQ